MNILKDPLLWAAAATAGAYITFGPLVLTMAGFLDNEIARWITLHIGLPIFIPSVIATLVAQRFKNRVH